MQNELNNKHLLTLLLRKDNNAQKQLVDLQGKNLFALCIRYMGDRSLAKDILQESFIRIFQNIDQYDPDKGALENWMKTITIRMCLNALKSRKQYDNIYNMNGEVQKNVSEAHIQNPKAIEKLNTDDLLVLVENLPSRYREVFNLSVIEGYSHAEISKMLDIKESSSRSRLTRAKEMLRNKFKKNTKLNISKSNG